MNDRTLAIAIAATIATAAGLGASAANAQDFDCRVAATAAETTICGSARLRALDDQMADLYGQLWGVLGNPVFDDSRRLGVRAFQRDFLASRDDCGTDTGCLIKLYQRRNLGIIHTIRKAGQEIDRRS